jgi:putative addiction module component (TIGR02574 family)
MTTTLEKIKKQIIALPMEERAELAHELILSLDQTASTDVEKSWNTEIKKRLDEIKSGKANGRPAENILAEIRAKYT